MEQILSAMALVMGLLTVTSVLSGLVTEALKKTLNEKKYEYSKNILAGISSVVVALLVGLGYLVLTHTPITADVIVYIIALIILSWLSAMCGYDKVVQTIKQLNGGTTNGNSKGDDSNSGV